MCVVCVVYLLVRAYRRRCAYRLLSWSMLVVLLVVMYDCLCVYVFVALFAIVLQCVCVYIYIYIYMCICVLLFRACHRC